MKTRTKIIIAIVIILAIVAGFALAGWLYIKHLYNKMEFKPLDKKISVKEQKLVKVERVGYTVVEWGGTNLH